MENSRPRMGMNVGSSSTLCLCCSLRRKYSPSSTSTLHSWPTSFLFVAPLQGSMMMSVQPTAKCLRKTHADWQLNVREALLATNSSGSTSSKPARRHDRAKVDVYSVALWYCGSDQISLYRIVQTVPGTANAKKLLPHKSPATLAQISPRSFTNKSPLDAKRLSAPMLRALTPLTTGEFRSSPKPISLASSIPTPRLHQIANLGVSLLLLQTLPPPYLAPKLLWNSGSFRHFHLRHLNTEEAIQYEKKTALLKMN